MSVVVCTLDRPEPLAECLRSLAAQRRPPDDVLVVDAGRRAPADGVVAGAAAHGLRVRRLASEPGLPRQRNRGIDAAEGDVVLFLDDDVVLDPGYLQALLDVYASDPDGRIGGVGGAQVPDPTPAEPWHRRAWTRLFLLESYGRGRVKRSGHVEYCLSPSAPVDVEFLSGCNMSFRRAVLDRVRFDERLAGYALGEDIEMSHRVARAWRLVLTPAARCDHRHVAGGRPARDDFRAMAVFNKYLFFREQVARRPADWLWYAWASLGDLLTRLRAPRRRGLRGLLRGTRHVLRHVRRGALPPGYGGPVPA